MLEALVFLIRKLPYGLLRASTWWLSRFWFFLVPVRLSVARRNLRRALPGEANRGALLRRNLQHVALTVAEGLRLADATRESLAESVRMLGWEHLQTAHGAGRGVIVVTIHLGCFELVPAVIAWQGLPTSCIYRDIGSRAAHKLWFSMRERSGCKPIGTKKAKGLITELLQKGELIVFAIDQHMPRFRAVVCRFFEQWASTTPAPARFAFDTGAAIVPVITWREGPARIGHHVLQCFPALTLEEPHEERERNIWHNTQRLTTWSEEWIRAHPEQWLWLHRRWKVEDAPQDWPIPS